MQFFFTRRQRQGLMLLLLLIVCLQAAIHFADFDSTRPVSLAGRQWLAMARSVDSMQRTHPPPPKIYPFNPNFITDYKGYRLGMTVPEIDRLFAFRKTGKFVNSASEFQRVTGISDSLLSAISPFFKFPDWVTEKKANASSGLKKRQWKEAEIVVADINTADAGALIAIRGIGPALSARILDMRQRLGGFVSMQQMDDVWGLQPEAVGELKRHFDVLKAPSVPKLKVNEASLKELLGFPYFHYPIGKNVLTYRSMHGRISDAGDLLNIEGIPAEKIKIIALYLEF
jgi:DNA uptake protein ComE-like DNA-binding protein